MSLSIQLRPANITDLSVLQRWDEQQHRRFGLDDCMVFRLDRPGSADQFDHQETE